MHKLLLVFLILLSGCTGENKTDIPARFIAPKEAYELETLCLKKYFANEEDSSIKAKTSASIKTMDCIIDNINLQAHKSFKGQKYTKLRENVLELKDNLLKFFSLIYMQNKNCKANCKNDIVEQYSLTSDVMRPILAQLIHYNDKKEGVAADISPLYKPNYSVEMSRELYYFIVSIEDGCNSASGCQNLINSAIEDNLDSAKDIKEVNKLINAITENYNNIYKIIFYPQPVPSDYIASLKTFFYMQFTFAEWEYK